MPDKPVWNAPEVVQRWASGTTYNTLHGYCLELGLVKVCWFVLCIFWCGWVLVCAAESAFAVSSLVYQWQLLRPCLVLYFL